MIRTHCPNCGKALGLPDSAAGAMGMCPQCKHIFPIPLQSDPELAPREEEPELLEEDEEILDAVADEPRRRKRRKRRGGIPDNLRVPIYMQEQPDEGFAAWLTHGRIAGLIAVFLALLLICSGLAVAIFRPVGDNPQAFVNATFGGVGCGLFILVVGLVLIAWGGGR